MQRLASFAAPGQDHPQSRAADLPSKTVTCSPCIMKFLAIDFETANYERDSACAVGLALVENGIIIKKEALLIRPPSRWFVFTDIHGITWEDVERERTFGQHWKKIRPFFNKIDFAVAHSASFDAGVLRACCDLHDIETPDVEFRCTVRLSRQVWGIRPTTLPDVCRKLKIPLKHHDAMSDTLACAKIMIEVLKERDEV